MIILNKLKHKELKSEMLQVRVTKELKEKILKELHARNLTTSDLLMAAIDQFLKECEK